MYKLLKVKELTGYRFFQNYKWDESDCPLFNTNNIIYGWNGSGKTTLCDFLKELSLGEFENPDTKFSLLFKNDLDNSTHQISQNNVGAIPYIVKVFHQNYISENISNTDNVRHIFAVGKVQKEQIEEVKKLKQQEKDERAVINDLDSKYTSALEAFDRLKTSKAKAIKDAAKYSAAYNKRKFYDAYKNLTEKHILSDAEYQKLLASIRAEPRPEIKLINTSFIQPSVKPYISDILMQTPVNLLIDSLKQDKHVSIWVEQGLGLHEERGVSTCLFCGNPISRIRFDELRAHFNKSYKELSGKIDSAISLLHDKIAQFDDAKASLPDVGLLYTEFATDYATLRKVACSICDDYSAKIGQIIDILKKKKADMINGEYVNEFITIVDLLSFDYSIFDKILDVIRAHNKKTESFHVSIADAKRQIEKHYISEFAEEISTAEEKIERISNDLDSKRTKYEKLITKISELEQKVKDSQIPADLINKDIEFIMGRNELVFSNSEMGYKITRKGRIAKNLSKGEENAVALIYFFNSLLDINSDAKNTIVVLDDPISSFDTNFYYNAISYIRDKTEEVGQTFIFTHKFSLYKDFTLMYKESVNQYVIERTLDSPRIKKADKIISQYHDEYAYLFNKIYWFVKRPPSNVNDYLQYPNMARRLLEGYISFKLPLPSDGSMMDKVLKLENGHNTAAGRAILRLLNNRSHLRVIQNGDIADEIDSISSLPEILKNLLDFMKHHDSTHYNTLAKQCDPTYSADGDSVEIERINKRYVKLYEMAASAGYGSFLDESVPSREIEITNPDCTYAVKIAGDSMAPDIEDGCIVLVKKCDTIPPAHIGIVWYNGEAYCKKIVTNESGILLVSNNRNYQPIKATEDFHVFGEVIEIIPKGT